MSEVVQFLDWGTLGHLDREAVASTGDGDGHRRVVGGETADQGRASEHADLQLACG